MQIEDIFRIAAWGQVVFDPARPRLYFTESRADKKKNRMLNRIMMMETEGAAAAPVALTNGPGDLLPLPSPDGQRLAFLSRRSGSSQIWSLPLQGGEPVQITFIQGGIKHFAWSPDSRGLVAVAHIEQGRLDREKAPEEPKDDATDADLEKHYTRSVKYITHQYYKLDGEGFFDNGRDQLVWVPLEGEIELLTGGIDNYSNPVFSPDGENLYCLHRAYDPEGAHPGIAGIRQLRWQTKEWTRIPVPEWSIAGLEVSGDGKHLAFYAGKPEDLGYGLTSLYRWDLQNDTLTDLSSSTDRPVGNESSSDVPVQSNAKPAWRDDKVLMLLSDEGRVMLTEFDNGQVTRLWDGKRVVYDYAVRGDEVALAIADPTHPSGIVLARFGQPEGAAVWAPTPWTEGSEKGPRAPEEIWAAESDGTRVHTWCIRPEGTGPFPTILEIHGGPMAMYGYRYCHEFQCLADAGYAVVYTNPRGSQAYGLQFGNAIIGEWGDKDYRDVMAGLDAALSQWTDLDRDRLGVAGGSYGGFMVNWIISHSRRFKAAVTMRSVVNRFSAMGSSDMGWLRVPQYGTLPWWEEPEPYWQQSPLKYASNIHTPLLIEHQEKDFRLPIEQGEQLYSALKYLGRTVEMVLYPDESHGMSRNGKPWHKVHRLRTIIGWFNRYLQAREQEELTAAAGKAGTGE